MMKRAFASAPKPARHRFRRSLPARVLMPLPTPEPEVVAARERFERLAAMRSVPVDPRRITLQDVKDFLIAYCACFIAVSAFIA